MYLIYTLPQNKQQKPLNIFRDPKFGKADHTSSNHRHFQGHVFSLQKTPGGGAWMEFADFGLVIICVWSGQPTPS